MKWHELRRQFGQLCLWSSLKQDVPQKFKKCIPKNNQKLLNLFWPVGPFVKYKISNMFYSDNHNKNYLAATAWLFLCCCTAISHHHSFFSFLLFITLMKNSSSSSWFSRSWSSLKSVYASHCHLNLTFQVTCDWQLSQFLRCFIYEIYFPFMFYLSIMPWLLTCHSH